MASNLNGLQMMLSNGLNACCPVLLAPVNIDAFLDGTSLDNNEKELASKELIAMLNSKNIQNVIRHDSFEERQRMAEEFFLNKYRLNRD